MCDDWHTNATVTERIEQMVSRCGMLRMLRMPGNMDDCVLGLRRLSFQFEAPLDLFHCCFLGFRDLLNPGHDCTPVDFNQAKMSVRRVYVAKSP